MSYDLNLDQFIFYALASLEYEGLSQPAVSLVVFRCDVDLVGTVSMAMPDDCMLRFICNLRRYKNIPPMMSTINTTPTTMAAVIPTWLLFKLDDPVCDDDAPCTVLLQEIDWPDQVPSLIHCL